MNKVAVAGLAIMVASLALLVTALILALQGSRFAPSLTVLLVVLLWSGLCGAVAAMVSLLRRDFAE